MTRTSYSGRVFIRGPPKWWLSSWLSFKTNQEWGNHKNEKNNPISHDHGSLRQTGNRHRKSDFWTYPSGPRLGVGRTGLRGTGAIVRSGQALLHAIEQNFGTLAWGVLRRKSLPESPLYVWVCERTGIMFKCWSCFLTA